VWKIREREEKGKNAEGGVIESEERAHRQLLPYRETPWLHKN